MQGEGLGFATSRFGSHLISPTQQLHKSLNIPGPFSHLYNEDSDLVHELM